jgi:hypothetical protein
MITLGFSDGETLEYMTYGRDGFGFHNDLLFCDGVYYGDWEVGTFSGPEKPSLKEKCLSLFS